MNRNKSSFEKFPVVRISVEGGMATVIKKSKGVQVVIVDEDCKKVGENSLTLFPTWDVIGK